MKSVDICPFLCSKIYIVGIFAVCHAIKRKRKEKKKERYVLYVSYVSLSLEIRFNYIQVSLINLRLLYYNNLLINHLPSAAKERFTWEVLKKWLQTCFVNDFAHWKMSLVVFISFWGTSNPLLFYLSKNNNKFPT